jgi:hypothetical protein
MDVAEKTEDPSKIFIAWRILTIEMLCIVVV